MSAIKLTNKGKMYGHNVSFSQHKTRKVFKPNLQKKTITVNGQKLKVYTSASELRTMKKKGLLK